MAAPAKEAQPQAQTQAVIPQAAQASTPTGTSAIKVVPAPAPSFAYLPAFSTLAIVVPVVTLLGVILTIWFGRWKTKTELTDSRDKWGIDRQDTLDKITADRKHAAEEARTERLTKARREVYLELIREMTAASMALGGMPFQKGEEVEIQAGFQGFISAVSRVAILGEMDTVVKSRELMSFVQEVLYKKMPNIVEMRLARAEQAKFELAKERQLEKSDGIKQVMMDMLRDKKMDNINAWNQGLDGSDLKAKQYAEKGAKCNDVIVALSRAYQHSMIDEAAEIGKKTNELIACIRKELELSTDYKVLELSTADMAARAKNAIENMYKAIEA